MPELTPQQKQLEKLYRGKTKARPPTLKQKSLNRSLNKPSVSNAQKAAGATASRSAAVRSKIRSTKASYKGDLTRFGSEVKSASTKARVSSAQNISKFGGGVKARFGATVVAVKKVAVKQGIKTPVLSRLFANSAKFLAPIKSSPALLLTVGNLIVWKKNIETLKGIYGQKSPQPTLLFSPSSDLIAGEISANFTGGQDPNASYDVSWLTTEKRTRFGTIRQSGGAFFGVLGVIKKIGVSPRLYESGEVNSTTPMNFAYVTYQTPGDIERTVFYQTSQSSYVIIEQFDIVVTRTDNQLDTGGNLPPIANAVYSTGGVSTGYLPTQPSKAKPKPLISPETESEKLTKPLAIPATSPKIEPVPDVIPEVEPLPAEERDIFIPTSPTEAPPIKKEDTTNPAVKKKPAASTKTTYYPEELPGDVKRAIEESKERQPETTKVIKGYSPAPVPGKAVEVVPGVSSPSTEPILGDEQTTPTLPPVPVFRPAPTTTIKNPPAPAPTVTPVDGCKKGCSGGSGGLSQADSDNLASTNSLLQLLDISLLKKIDATTTITKDTVKSPTFGLQKIQQFASTAWQTTQADKVLQVVNTALIIHNGMMLSNNILQTLGEAANMALDAVGVKDHTGQAINVNALVKNKINAILSKALGASNYAALTARIAKANRIYQASANVLSNVRSIIDSTQDIAETTGENVSVIGNALKKGGVVRENAYNWMPENLNNTSRVLNRLEKISDGADAISDITSEAQSLSEDIKDMETNRGVFLQELTKTTETKTKTETTEKASVESVPEPSEKDEIRGVDGNK
jgi:hypothetical protein